MAHSFDVKAYQNLPVLAPPSYQAYQDQRRAAAYSAEQFQKVQEDTLDQDHYDRSSNRAKDQRVFDAAFETPPQARARREDAFFNQQREQQQAVFQHYQRSFDRDVHEVPAGLALYVATLYEENRSRAFAPPNPGGNLDLET